MNAKEVNELGRDEIAERVRDESEQLRALHFQHAIAELPNPMVIRHKRRLIARLKTILRQKDNVKS